MQIDIQNENLPLQKKVFIDNTDEGGDMELCCWYGGDHVELVKGSDVISFNRKEFDDLCTMVLEMYREVG